MPPTTLLIKPVSNSCNMRCAYCFYADVTKHRGVASYGAMTPQTCETLVRKALNYADGFCTFGFQGGEPTLAGLDFYRSLIRLQRENNRRNVRINNSIQTNGYRLGKEWAEFLSANDFLVGLSMDGTKAAHDGYRAGPGGLGTYDAAAETAELFREHGVEFNILCVVNGAVAASAREVYANLRKYRYLQFIPCIDEFGADDESAHPPGPAANAKSAYTLGPVEYAHFLKTAFDGYYNDFMGGEYVSVRNFDNYIGMILGNRPEQCGMSGVCSCYFLVEADGSVFPCDFYVLDEWKIGNVNENSFARMLGSAAAKDFVAVSRNVHADCAACGWRGLCRGGCRRYREPAIGGVLQKNKFCAAYADFFGHSYEKMLKIADRIRRGRN